MSETPNPIAGGDGGSANMLPTPKELREIRRLKANNYRTMYLLPRFVQEEDGSKRKLEAGEFDPKSKLYPISTPIKDMSDFGIFPFICLSKKHFYSRHKNNTFNMMILFLIRCWYWNVLYDNNVVRIDDGSMCHHSIADCRLFRLQQIRFEQRI